ncbi:hypothetical protein [Paraburkholderia aromaticivorans]|uniref:hypothetical protein n=1 Tax=Paraburkholderia aromaticivorans TaxID=2026199 RepID=UPI0038B819B3
MKKKYQFTVNRIETTNFELEMEFDDDDDDEDDAVVDEVFSIQEHAYELGEWKPLRDEVVCIDSETQERVFANTITWGASDKPEVSSTKEYIWAWDDGEGVSLNRSNSLVEIIERVTSWHHRGPVVQIEGGDSDTLTINDDGDISIIGNNIEEVEEWINEESYGQYYGVSIEQI